MTLTAFEVAAVRARFSALDRPLAFFDAPAGTQAPDEVIDAIAGYLRHANANLGTPDYDTARETVELVEHAHDVAGSFLGCAADDTVFGANMTTLNFALSRAAARELRAGDEVVVTRLDHDASVSPWLELARDLDLVVRFADVDDECSLDLADLERQLSDRTRVVAFPLASNAIGTVTDVTRVVELAHAAGALAWADAVHFAPHAPIDVAALGVDVLLCSPYKFYGPHLGLAYVKSEVAERWRPYKVRPAANEPLGRRFRRAPRRTSYSQASSLPSNTSSRSGGKRSMRRRRRSAHASSPGCPITAVCTAQTAWTSGFRRSPSPQRDTRPQKSRLPLDARTSRSATVTSTPSRSLKGSACRKVSSALESSTTTPLPRLTGSLRS